MWDNMASLQQQGFSVEPSKGIVEAGHKRTITITWAPHSGYKVRKILNSENILYRRKCMGKCLTL